MEPRTVLREEVCDDGSARTGDGGDRRSSAVRADGAARPRPAAARSSWPRSPRPGAGHRSAPRRCSCSWTSPTASERTLEKFRVLELVARVPYQAWENVAYVAVTHTASEPGFARRVFDRVRVNRWEQDNEQWHLLILEEMLADEYAGAEPLGWFRAAAAAPAHGVRLLPALVDHVRDQAGMVVPAQRRLRGPRRARVRVARRGASRSGRTTPFVSEFAGDFGHYDRSPTCSARSATTSGSTSCRANRR